jgi:hypothetical protein
MKQLLEYKWSFVALAGLLAGLLLARGGVASLMPLVRFLIPIVIIVVVAKFASKKLRSAASDFVAKNMGQMGQAGGFGNVGAGAGGKRQPVIDLCPKCGSYLKPGHKCS